MRNSSIISNSFRFYMAQVGLTPLISIQEEKRLARKIMAGDPAARDHMIRANLRLVVKIARSYENFGLPLPDLVSEGNMGLMDAVDRFDPDKGGKLSTYASWWIKKSIMRALSNQGKTIRIPVHLSDTVSKMRRATTSLYENLGRDPSNEELAAELKISPQKVSLLRTVSSSPSSLDSVVGEDPSFGTGLPTLLSDTVPDPRADGPFDFLNRESVLKLLNGAMGKLQYRESEVLKRRFGLDGGEANTLLEVGRLLGLTRERVRQLQIIAMQKIRLHLATP